jgi:hypothetical protein
MGCRFLYVDGVRKSLLMVVGWSSSLALSGGVDMLVLKKDRGRSRVEAVKWQAEPSGSSQLLTTLLILYL